MENRTDIPRKTSQGLRKPLRLHNYNYSNPGLYFVTISTIGHEPLLGALSEGPDHRPYMHFTKVGSLAEKLLYSLPFENAGAHVGKAIVMPNHVHILFFLEGVQDKRTTLTRVVQYYKSQVSKQTGPIWQRTYYDHVIRSEADLERVWTYIDQNPTRWLQRQLSSGDTEVAPT